MSWSSKDDILQDLISVGNGKAIGYLPKRTFYKIAKCNISLLRKLLNPENQIIIFHNNETWVNSGAIFVYNEKLINNVLFEYGCISTLDNIPRRIVEIVAKIYVTNKTSNKIKMIRRLFYDNLYS